ncbi:hypothetical protein K435DRAFT_860837 [Dendrothele bispora CBS 962.96]|uniref:Uncharacterized protein n=1 Tax=Dendrothele bispora (strain CBS 962.96) TaxID=1314807 RepID=A0A4S8LYC2_DENBC|nr:hypothetical protein K435DRAFT_860837 [Dendrothele bispora CBS 962.96]
MNVKREDPDERQTRRSRRTSNAKIPTNVKRERPDDRQTRTPRRSSNAKIPTDAKERRNANGRRKINVPLYTILPITLSKLPQNSFPLYKLKKEVRLHETQQEDEEDPSIDHVENVTNRSKTSQ